MTTGVIFVACTFGACVVLVGYIILQAWRLDEQEES